MNIGFHYTILQTATIIKGDWLLKNKVDDQLSYLSLDSRKVVLPDSTVFFALRNQHQNANLFIESLYQKGVRNFVTDEEGLELKKIPKANVILVKNTLVALQHLASYHRNQFREGLTVIGITGSNGKTIVKEWLNQLLENELVIVRSPKSFNSQIGVPLSVLNINESHNLGLFEAGISLPHEMNALEKMIHPQIGIITNIGNAHDEGFNSRQQKTREKLLLFKNADQLIFCGDDEELHAEIISFQQKHKGLNLFSWGKKKDSLLRIKGIHKEDGHTRIEALYKKEIHSITIPFIDEASIENAIHCWCALWLLRPSNLKLADGFSKLYPIAMRLEVKQGINHCSIINDSYSNDLHSLAIAISFLKQQKQHSRYSIILSDILQSGLKPQQLYKEVGMLLHQHKIDRFIAIGPDLFSQQQEFSFHKNAKFFKSTEDFLKNAALQNFNNENILVKGARSFEFEKITHALEQKVHQTVLSINLSALAYNLKQYKEKVKPATKIMVMVKAPSYGSGSYEIASVLEYNKVDYLAVAYADEGVELRKAGITLPIMVLNIDRNSFDSIVNYQLEPEIFSLGLLNDFTHFVKGLEENLYPVHLKIDTGMHRLGFMEEEMDALCQHISKNGNLKIKSVFSHLAASEDKNEDDFTKLQFEVFNRCCTKIEQSLGYTVIKHIDNTSGISRHPGYQMDMVRLGIGLYGIDANKKMQRLLKNVSTLTTTISQIKNVKAGETVGYGRKAKLERDSTIAVVRIGYADGYFRIFGNGNGKMLIKNKLIPVVGNVCMDMTMLDITGFKNIKEGDEVVVFGESLSLSTLALWAQTIPYEIMTSVSQRVKRVYYEE